MSLKQSNLNIPHFGAFESTKIHGAGTDILATTRHLEHWREDLDMLRHAGMKDLRYPVPWHRIEARPGVFDFSWMDKPMAHMRRHGMRPVIDVLHHTSFPDWLENGFANPALPELFCRFIEAFTRRYDWVDRYTIFNEPLATTLLCTQVGAWYPYWRSDRAFVHMAINVAETLRRGFQCLEKNRPGFSSIYIDTCERHFALDDDAREWVDFLNGRRFWILDLVQGKLTEEHPVRPYLLDNGMTDEVPARFRDEPVRIDVLGLDYYPHSEMDWRRYTASERVEASPATSNPRGFAAIAKEYHNRYQLPIMLAETNVRGYVTDRLTWLRFMREQCESLVQSGIDFRGFCWFPSIDSTDWSNLCTRSTCEIDPQGVWYLDERRRTRFESELSEWHTRLARGEASSKDLPAYEFRPPMDEYLSGYAKLMSHWADWRVAAETEDEEQAA